MTALAGRRIVLGVSGGIAAYKAVEVCRHLMDEGAYVVPVLTRAATRFVGAATFSALASEPTRLSLFDDDDPIPHTTLGQTADCVVVAPATARLIGAYAAGISSDLLTATLIATRAPVVVCPAMHTEMWEHPSVVDNIAVLARRGVHLVGPESGRLAGGDEGAGRLSSPAEIVAAVKRVLSGSVVSAANPSSPGDMAGLTVVVTAGGTREPIDPVRYIGNRSSGKQGYAFAAEAVSRGAEVALITTVDRVAPDGVSTVTVDTAAEMAEATTKAAGKADIVVMAAAVADFRPVAPTQGKIKKRDGVPTVEMEPTTDILGLLGQAKPVGQTLVGFAAETEDLASNAAKKLNDKGADYIVANDVSAADCGFVSDTNEVLVLAADGKTHHVGLRSKRQVAQAVFDLVLLDRDRRPPQSLGHGTSGNKETL